MTRDEPQSGRPRVKSTGGTGGLAPDSRRRFVVELPEPSAFNGSLLPAGGGFLIVYRSAPKRLGACHLDRRYQVVPGSHCDLGLEENIDPRLLRTDAGTFLTTSYHGGDTDVERVELWAMSALSPVPAVGPRLAFSGGPRGGPGSRGRKEKNWAPFVHGGSFYYVYQVLPHRVLRVDFPAKCARFAFETGWTFPAWRVEWGRAFRGNTPPARLPDGTFLSTFHTVARPGDAGPGGQGYYNGFYRFEGAPPFRVLAASAAPVLTPADATGVNPYHSEAHHTCVFPLSLQVEGDLVRLAGGDNDRAVVVFHLSLGEVLAGMEAALPVEPGGAEAG